MFIMVTFIENFIESHHLTVTEPSPAQADSLEQIRIDNLTMSATDLVLAYVWNEVAAQQKYDRETLYIRGDISDIGIDAFGACYLTLNAKYKGFVEVQCYFEKGKEIADYQKGQTITVEGECYGLSMNVLLRHCRVVKK